LVLFSLIDVLDAICSGPFTSGSCFVQYGGVGLIVVACVGGALILTYFLYKKCINSIIIR
jgi:hypothetical protein